MPEENGQLEELEEHFEPAESTTGCLLSDGSTVQEPEGKRRFRVHRVLRFPKWQPPYNVYEVSAIEETELAEPSEAGEEPLLSSEADVVPQGAASSSETDLSERAETDIPSVFWLWEATTPETVSSLQHEAEILLQVNNHMLPKVYAQFQQNGNFYLVTEALPDKTLAEVVEHRELTLLSFLTILTQVSYALTQLHQSGWAHLGVRPQVILVGKPIKLVDLRWSTRIGEKPGTTFYHPGFSAPELIQSDQTVDEMHDIFSVGALLYYFANDGQPIPETGVQLLGWQCPYGGLVQILHRCLGSREERYPKMQILHQELLRLKRRYTPTTAYKVAGATTIGLEPSRTTNQDAYGYIELVAQSESDTTRYLVACVADGMGGMEAGEIASQTAVKVILSEAAETLSGNASLSEHEQANTVKEWAYRANEKVCEVMEQRRAKGGTTLLCCLLVGNRLSIAHVGDCRLYLVRNSSANLLTRDHSLAVALALQEGNFDPDAIRHHPDRSRLTRSLGDRSPLPSYFVDSLEVMTGAPLLELQDGDILLLCSDGLWEPVSESDMIAVLEQHANHLQEAARDLLRLAVERGAPDNATVLLVQVGQQVNA